MKSYYSDKLSAERLKRCYDIAPERVKQYLRAEIDFVLDKIKADSYILELGSGYGRILQKLSEKSKNVFGIDLSLENLLFTKKIYKRTNRFFSVQMNADNLAFASGIFDMVLCLQNGISAFKVDPIILVNETLRVLKSGGLLIFSSYSDQFWEHRLHWFQIQAEAGLVGEIDYEQTGNGVIVCRDGFKATTFGPEEFTSLAAKTGVDAEIVEVNNSIIFWIINVV